MRANPAARIAVETLPEDLVEITFTPLDIEANATTPTTGSGARNPVPPATVCPITRQPLNPVGKVYRCRQCGISYSPEGWDFLRQTSKGQCCGCRSVNTVLPVVRIREA
jgi:hypothetical protein